MHSSRLTKYILQENFSSCLKRNFANKANNVKKDPLTDSKPKDVLANVKGFSQKVLDNSDKPVGHPGACKSGTYKNPEYYSYHVDSFGESMVELEKYRLPPPSNKVPFKQ